MPRINVYVSDAMKEQMEKLADRQIKWSEAAQNAFEREIAIATFKGENMEQVVERLRASKSSFVDHERAEGRKHGREWAMNVAAYADLRRVANLQFVGDTAGYAAEFDRALGNERLDWGSSFWSDMSDDGQVPSDEYVESFVEGARDVWDKVCDKL